MKYVYGPLNSWRLKRSFGVDLISTEGRTCSFDCEYCQIQNINEITSERREFVDLEEWGKEVEEGLRDVGENVDYLTFSGTGEPTLALNFPEAVDAVKEITDKPLAILTNGSFFNVEEVREALMKLDYVIAELDAPNEEIFKKVSRPAEGIEFDEIISGYKKFSERYNGKFALEVMFTPNNKDYAEEIAELARKISPDEIQLNTPLRPCPVEHLSQEELKRLEQYFTGLDTINVYDSKRTKTKMLNEEEVIRRGRPVK